MAENGHNGPEERESRLDRLDDAYNLMIQDHEDFRREHKALLRAQVVMTENMEMLEKQTLAIGEKLDRLADQTAKLEVQTAKTDRGLRKTRFLVREIGDKLDGLISWPDRTQRENEVRFRRLEEKHNNG